MEPENLHDADFKFRQQGCCYGTDGENDKSKSKKLFDEYFGARGKECKRKTLGFSFE